MKKPILLYLFLVLFSLSAVAEETAMYRLYLSDKGVSTYSITQPEAFLSKKSIERRQRQQLPITASDLPISEKYLQTIEATGAQIYSLSKWVQTVVVEVGNDTIKTQLRELPFVREIEEIWRGELPVKPSSNPFQQPQERKDSLEANYYGAALAQIRMHRGDELHERGYTGQGMTIAVIDGGFGEVGSLNEYLNLDRIKGTKDFTHEQTDLYREKQIHGTVVLSSMLAKKPNVMVGTAPDADYYLFKSEVNSCELPIEEDYWIRAVEYADSIGVDVVNTSLGYTKFDIETMNHAPSQLDGQTIMASRAASMAASKGMVLFLAGGNEGAGAWRQIAFPSDAADILTVGAIQRDSTRTAFSGVGNTVDGRIKPDIMALGSGVACIAANGVTHASGTSLAAPVIAGLGACLWQALPQLTAQELIELMKESSNQYLTADSLMGYGIPDVMKALELKTIK